MNPRLKFKAFCSHVHWTARKCGSSLCYASLMGTLVPQQNQLRHKSPGRTQCLSLDVPLAPSHISLGTQRLNSTLEVH